MSNLAEQNFFTDLRRRVRCLIKFSDRLSYFRIDKSRKLGLPMCVFRVFLNLQTHISRQIKDLPSAQELLQR